MEVLLVNIPTFKYRLFGEHLGLGFLAASLRSEGIQTEIYDPCFENETLGAIADKIIRLNPTVLGLSVVSHLTIENSLALCELLALRKFRGHIVLGGHPATFLSRQLLEKAGNVFAVVKGDADITFKRLAAAMLKGRFSEIPQIPNLLVRREGKIFETPADHVLPELDTLPFPARDSLEAYPQLVKPVQILSSRGCSFGCSYCDIQAYYDQTNSGNKWAARSAENVVNEIETIVGKYGKTTFSFDDANFLGTGAYGVERAHRIADEILRRKLHIKFAITARAPSIHQELFSHLKEAGLHAVILGLESGVDSVLRRYNKGATVEHNLCAVKVIHDLGLYASYGFIYYDYATDVKDLAENAEFLKKIGYSSFKALEKLRIYSGTREEERVKDSGLLLTNKFASDYKFISPAVSAFDAIAEKLKNEYSLEDRIEQLRGKAIRYVKSQTEKSLARALAKEIKELKRESEAFFACILDFAIAEIRKDPAGAALVTLTEADRQHAALKNLVANLEKRLESEK